MELYDFHNFRDSRMAFYDFNDCLVYLKQINDFHDLHGSRLEFEYLHYFQNYIM